MEYKKEFEKSLKEIFIPTIKSYGFKGNGRNFYRKINNTIQTINIQGNKYGGSSCVNLGLHFDFLPSNDGIETIDEEQLKTYDSIFTMRLAPFGKSDYWWKYKGNFIFGSPRKSVLHLNKIFITIGIKQFVKFLSEKDILPLFPIKIIKRNRYIHFFGGITPQKAAITIARIYKYIGDDKNSLLFATEGLKICDHNSGLKIKFKEIINNINKRHSA
jgi:hypothetical protein